MSEQKKRERDHKEFQDLFDVLFDKIGYFGQAEDILLRALDYKIREVVVDMIIDHEKEYHAKDRAEKGYN